MESKFKEVFFSVFADIIRSGFRLQWKEKLENLGYSLEEDNNNFPYCLLFENVEFEVLLIPLDLIEGNANIINYIYSNNKDSCKKHTFIIGLFRNFENNELYKVEPKFEKILPNFIASEFIDFERLNNTHFSYFDLKERFINANFSGTNFIDIYKFTDSKDKYKEINEGIFDEILKILRCFKDNYTFLKKFMRYKEGFFDMFIKPYIDSPLKNSNVSSIYENYLKLIGEEEVIRYQTHYKENEIFRLPTPFFFQDFIMTLLKFKELLEKRSKEIRLLLVDNKPEEKKDKVNRILRKFELSEYFEVVSCKKDIFNSRERIEKIIQEEIFEDKKPRHHFILMDFFLYRQEIESKGFTKSVDLVIASEFLELLEEYKINNRIYYKDWVFMVSDYSESFIKYLQGGVVSETLSTIFVNFGESTHEQRSIIFVYKLLKFILNRLENFYNLNQRLIFFINEGDNEIKDYIYILDELIKENMVIGDVFFNKKDDVERLYIALKNLIEMYLYNSPVDWPILERQIDFVDYLLNKISIDNNENMFKEISRFNNKKILKDLKKWKTIY